MNHACIKIFDISSSKIVTCYFPGHMTESGKGGTTASFIFSSIPQIWHFMGKLGKPQRRSY